MPKEKCYDGPCGVFWDAKHQEIFILEWDGCQMYPSMNKAYKYWRGKEYFPRMLIVMSRDVVRLGPL